MMIIGLGTGRCGSMSLSHLLNAQTGCGCTHEMTYDFKKFIVQPLDINNPEMADIYLDNINSRTLPIKADISLWWLNFVDQIVDKYKDDVKFICLRRDKEQTVNSYVKKMNINGTNGMNHVQDHDGSFYAKNPWDASYPNFEADSLPEALGLYWEDYYKRSEEFTKKYPNQFKLVDMLDLNDKDKVLDLLNFCEIPNPNVVIKQSNKG
tara:strand:+ start:1759 stop:2382 length:624 start_codon:yes stop_codon:yes gene_type:complete